MDGILTPPQIIFECDNFADVNDKDGYSTVLSDLMSQDITYSLFYIKPDECNIKKISLTKLLIEFNETSLFETKVTDFYNSINSLNNTLGYKDAIVTSIIIPRKVKYREFEASISNVAANIRKDRIEAIIMTY